MFDFLIAAVMNLGRLLLVASVLATLLLLFAFLFGRAADNADITLGFLSFIWQTAIPGLILFGLSHVIDQQQRILDKLNGESETDD